MITREEYEAATAAKDAAQKTINDYFREKSEAFAARMRDNPVFTPEELIYSANTLCPCGHGLAYPKDCDPHHYWDCSAILTGTANPGVEHTAKLPFAFYDVKSENEHRGTTRGVFKPKTGA